MVMLLLVVIRGRLGPLIEVGGVVLLLSLLLVLWLCVPAAVAIGGTVLGKSVAIDWSV